MATLEQERPTINTQSSPLDDISELSASIPTPFPTRGRTGQTNPPPSSSSRNASSSRSPSSGNRPVLGLLDKVKRAMSRDRNLLVGGDNKSVLGDRDSLDSSATEEYRGRLNPLIATTTRSSSSSRTAQIHSTGRGGAGNTFIRSPSRGRALIPAAEGDELLNLEVGEESSATIQAARAKSDSRSRSRGRVEVVTSGRGGRGNVRSPSRDPGAIAESMKEAAYEKEVEEARMKAGPSARGMSSGRGGRGNIIPIKSNSDALGGMAA